MKAYPGGKRTRKRAKRPDHLKRKYRRKTAGGMYTPVGCAVWESMARDQVREVVELPPKRISAMKRWTS